MGESTSNTGSSRQGGGEMGICVHATERKEAAKERKEAATYLNEMPQLSRNYSIERIYMEIKVLDLYSTSHSLKGSL